MAMCWALTERAGKTQINTAKCLSILAALVCNKLKAGQWIRWFIQLSVWMCGCVCVCVNVCIYIRSLQMVPCCLLVNLAGTKCRKEKLRHVWYGSVIGKQTEQEFHLPVFVFLCSCPNFSSLLTSPGAYHPISHQSLLFDNLGYNSFNMSYKFSFSEGQTSVSFLQCKNLFLIIH